MRRRCTLVHLGVILFLLGLFIPQTQAETPTTKASPPSVPVVAGPVTPENVERAKLLGRRLASEDAAEYSRATEELKQWLKEEPKTAPLFLIDSLTNNMLNSLVWDAKCYQRALDLLKEAKPFLTTPRHQALAAAMQASCLIELRKYDEGLQIARDVVKQNRSDLLKPMLMNLIRALSDQRRYDDALDLSNRAALSAPEDESTMVLALQQKIAIWNAQDKFQEGLAEAKSIFNLCSMAKTAESLVLVDRQINVVYLDDPSVSERFRNEQTAEAKVGATGGTTQPGGAKSFLTGVKIDPSAYAAEIQGRDGSTLPHLTARIRLLLMADRCMEAMTLAKRAYSIAKNQNEIAAATELVARCMKAQDGTIGRANAYIMSLQPKNK